LLEHMAKEGVELGDPTESLLGYSSNLGTAAGKASLASEVPNVMDELGLPSVTAEGKPVFTSLHAGMDEVNKNVAAIEQYAKESLNPEALDTAATLKGMLGGLPPRGLWNRTMNMGNSYFKKSAVYGFGIPRIGSIVRNDVNGVAQFAAEEPGLGQIGKRALQVPGNILKSLGRGVDQVLGTHMVEDDFTAVENALKNANGKMSQWIANIPEGPMRDFVRLGGFQSGYVKAEDLVKETASRGFKKWLKDAMDMPGTMWKADEQYMRYGSFKNLVEDGMAPEDAMRKVTSAYYDYGNRGSLANRAIRDNIPFFQYGAKAIPQMSKFMFKHPAVATSIGAVYGQSRDNPVYPYMQEKTNLPLGTNTEGDQIYATSMGWPWESLSMIPNPSADINVMGRQIMQNDVGMSQPLLKSAVSAVTGRDPYFESPYGSYSKLPGNIEGGAAGQMYNKLAGTGLIQPLASIAQTIGTMADARTSTGDKLIDMLSGAKVSVVDEDRAMQQIIEDYLKRNPDVKQFSSFYQTSADPKTQAFLDSLKDAKKRLKSKKKAKDAAKP
jgi:hypothetical protein